MRASICTSAFLPKPIWARFPCSPPGAPLTNVGPHHTVTRASIEPNSQPFLWHVELFNAVNFGEVNIKFSRRDWSTSATGRISIHAMGETAPSAIWVHSETEWIADDPAITKIRRSLWLRHVTTAKKLIHGSAQSTVSNGGSPGSPLAITNCERWLQRINHIEAIHQIRPVFTSYFMRRFGGMGEYFIGVANKVNPFKGLFSCKSAYIWTVERPSESL